LDSIQSFRETMPDAFLHFATSITGYPRRNLITIWRG
jgi:hypothetical protein